MSVIATIESLVRDFRADQVPRPGRRRAALARIPGKIDVAIGMRRTGKTWLLFQEIHDLLVGGLTPDRILYVNFEDERLVPFATEDLRHLDEAMIRLRPGVGERWLFLDEVHNVPRWDLFVRRLLDRGDVRLVLSGSSANLLSREIATSLRGRSLATEVHPYGFDEFLVHRGHRVPDAWPVPTVERLRLEAELDHYLRIGGFPEVQDFDEATRLRVLQDYVDVVLFRDVVERHGITNASALRQMTRRLLARPAGAFSVHRFHNDLKSQGVAASRDTLHELLAHLEDAFLVHPVAIHSASEKARQVNPRKVYLADHALARTRSFAAPGDVGHLLENVVEVELRRRGASVAYVTTRSGYEVDFLAETPTAWELVQVCADLSAPDTRERELRAVVEAMEELQATTATVVTLRQEETVELRGREVRVVPAWRWLLGG